jgi:hypothetical protein
MALAIILPLAYAIFAHFYWSYRDQQVADAAAQAAAEKEKAAAEAQEREQRLDRQEKEREHQRELEAQERENRLQAQAQIDAERERTKQAELERLRQAEEAERAKVRQAEEERRVQARQEEERRLAAIATDHEIITRFIKKSVTEAKLEDIIWSGPYNASKDNKGGRLYRLDCRYYLFSKGKIPATYQFFLVGMDVDDWQQGDKLKICELDGSAR